MNNSFGYIVAIQMAGFNVPFQDAVQLYHDIGFEDKYIPNERMSRQAFKKALKDATAGENFMVRKINGKGSTLVCGLVQEERKEEEKDLKYDVANVLTLNADLDIIEGKTGFRMESIKEGFLDNKKSIGMVEITFKLKQLLFEIMAIDILCHKCIFVPSQYQPQINQIQKLFEGLKKFGANLHVDVIEVDNGTQTRKTILRSFSEQTVIYLQRQIDFCVFQRRRFETGEIKFLRPTAFRRLLDKVAIVEERVRTYIKLLSMDVEESQLIIQKIEEVDKEINTNIDLSVPSRKTRKNQKAILDSLKL